jgi:hypothetical protein
MDFGDGLQLKVNRVLMGYFEAYKFCRLMGGKLAEPTSMAMDETLADIMADHLLPDTIWLGFNDIHEEGK